LFNHQGREAGDQILQIENSERTERRIVVFQFNLLVNKGDKIAVLSENSLATTAFYQILTGEDHSLKDLLNGYHHYTAFYSK